MMDVISQKPSGFDVLSGDDNLTLPLIAAGGVGVISVVSNLIPKEVSEFVNVALNGDYEKARKLHYKLLPLFKNLFIETNPIPVKYAGSLKGLCRESYRLPMCPMQDANKEKLRKVLKEIVGLREWIRIGAMILAPAVLDAVRYFTPEQGGVSHFRYLRDNVLLTWMHVRLILEGLVRLPFLLRRRLAGR